MYVCNVHISIRLIVLMMQGWSSCSFLPFLSSKIKMQSTHRHFLSSIRGLVRQQPQKPDILIQTRPDYQTFQATSKNADEENDDDEEEDTTITETSCDWMEAELTLLGAPCEPNPNLDAEMVARICCRSLQWVDYPSANAGLVRCYSFMTFECRKAVTARKGGESVDSFCMYGALSPALQPFMGSTRVDIGQGTYTPAYPPMRGELVSFPISITGASVLSLQYPSGMTRAGIGSSPPTTQMVVRLEAQRRPPYQGCWLVREILDVRHVFAGDLGNAHVGG